MSYQDTVETGAFRVICACGHNARYDSASAFSESDGLLMVTESGEKGAASCPGCEKGRPCRTSRVQWDDIGPELIIVLGEFEEEYTPFKDGVTLSYNVERVSFEAVADPVHLAAQRFDPVCMRCGTRLSDEDLNTDSGAPEIGWEYYTCPNCDLKSNPDSVQPLG